MAWFKRKREPLASEPSAAAGSVQGSATPEPATGADAAAGAWDCHCHILPGMDDGAPDMETAVAMVRLAATSGTGTILATAHAIDGLHPNRRPQVLARLEELRARCTAKGLGVSLLPNMEIAFTPEVPARLKAGELVTMGDAGRAALVEFPSTGIPVFWQSAFFELGLLGVTPVIAHVERTPLLGDEALAERMIAAGARFQVNATTLRPGGRTERLLASWLARGWVVCVGSDAHDLVHRPPVLLSSGGRTPPPVWLDLMRRRPGFVPG